MPSDPPDANLELGVCPCCGSAMVAFRSKAYCTECEYYESCCDGGKM